MIPTLAGAAVTLTLTLLSLLPSAYALGSASTLAVVDSTASICGIIAGVSPASIHCTGPFPSLLPNVSFDSISAGNGFLCGLRSGGNSLICWNWNSSAGSLSRRRLYTGNTTLSSISVGVDQVAGVNDAGVTFWRGVGGRYPDFVPGVFRSLTSGRDFSCAIGRDSKVRCWGRSGGAIQSGFGNMSMSSIVAGDSHICGINIYGILICRGSNNSNQLDAPAGPAFTYSNLALGAAHSCAIRNPNGTVVCWGDGRRRSYAPANGTAFVSLVAGGNLTCGLSTVNYSVVCWRPDGSDPFTTVLPRILPGICVFDDTSCNCGVFPDSGSLCSDSRVICNQCGATPPVPPVSPPTVSGRRRSKGFLVFAIVGAVGGFAGLCTILFWLWRGVCRQKRVHNTVIPTITAAATAADGGSSARSDSPAAGPALFTSRSRAFRRQSSSVVMRRQRSGPSRIVSFSNLQSFKTEAFTFSDLAAATKDFALENKIGAGSFGTVYRGKLADGREVAIKRSENVSKTKKYQEKESAFQSELAFLSRLHHKHLVGLVGFCEERDERLLVYEYMKNGALYDHLHPGGGGGGEAAPELSSWKMRIKLLLDAARGVEYLHNYAVPPIIHRDIKSSNILIDGEWVARVSDFGLSLIGPETGGEEHLSLKAAGTVGYMDPEYYGLQQLTAKSDVYGLGVVMLEVLTGKRAIFKEEGGSGPESVVDYAVPSIVSGGLGRVLDPALGVPRANESDAVELLAYTAVRCVSLEGRERPSMSDVVDNLESALALCEDSPGRISSESVRSSD